MMISKSKIVSSTSESRLSPDGLIVGSGVSPELRLLFVDFFSMVLLVSETLGRFF